MGGRGTKPGEPGDLFASSSERVWTVSELTGQVRRQLETHFGLVRVTGELSRVSLASSGHAYFQLVDERASLSAVMFRSARKRVGGELPPEGAQVECLGRLTLYEARGRTQLVVEWMMESGEGEYALQLMRLKRRLEAEGLFDPARKRPLPFLPSLIGVVTSPTGAAVRDILQVLGRRMPSVPVLICPVRVQGEGAGAEIAAAIERMGDGLHGQVMIVGRGGGSAEDLWAFNEERVVRAIASARVPVVSAVGHETDQLLCDLVADQRAPTPSAAAELVVPDRAELLSLLHQRARSLVKTMRLHLGETRAHLLAGVGRMRDPRLLLAGHRLRMDESTRRLSEAQTRAGRVWRERLAELRVRLAVFEPRVRLRADRDRLERLAAGLRFAMATVAAQHRRSLTAAESALQGLSPLSILSRGYGLVTDPGGDLLRDASQLAAGQQVRVRLARGRFEAQVTQVEAEEDPLEVKKP